MKTTQVIFLCLQMWIVLTITGSFDSPSDETCEDGWVKSLSRCYYFSDKGKDWFSAWEACGKMYGHLLSVESDAERDSVNSYIQKHMAGEYDWWTSGSNDNEMNQWAWYGTFAEIVYDNRCTDESVTGDPDGKCLAMGYACNYGEIRRNCMDASLRYVCEKDIVG